MRRITIVLVAALTVGISAAAGRALPLAGSESILGFATEAHTRRLTAADDRTHLRFSAPAAASLYGVGLPGARNRDFSLSLTRRQGTGFVFVSLKDWDGGMQQSVGGAFDRFSLQFQHGEGDGILSERPLADGMSPRFFHGSVGYPYRYTGAAADIAWSDALRFSAGSVWIDSPEMDRRSVVYGGIAYRNLTGTVADIKRAGRSVGHRVALGLDLDGVELGYEELVSRSAAWWREVGAAFALSDYTDRVQVNLGMGRNPLFDEVTESRISISYTLVWGGKRSGRRRPLEHRRGEPAAALAAAAHRFDDGQWGGLSQVGAGLAISSGSPVIDTAPRFGSQDEAALYVLSQWNPQSVAVNREYGSSIYRSRDGSFSPSSLVVAGTVDTVAFNPHALVPPGTWATAAWHTHGAYMPGYLNEQFSTDDLVFYLLYQVDGYLGTPAGRMLLFDLDEFRTYTFVDDDGNPLVLPH